MAPVNESELRLSIRADGYDSAQLETLSVLGEREEELIKRLQGEAPILLEGVRGSGKTTLLRLAEQRTNKDKTNLRKVAVYVSFSRYLLLENPKIPVGANHPFRFWVCTKVAQAVYDTLKEVTGQNPAVPVLEPLVSIGIQNVIDHLEGTHELQDSTAAIAPGDPSLRNAITSFHDPDALRSILEAALDAFGVSTLVLLCDEAAQYFKPEFQPLFFSTLRGIYSQRISFKAAVYPTITYFGADFELGHDATVVQITRPCLSAEWMALCEGIFERRWSKAIWEQHPIFIQALAYASFGVPRRFIELAGSLTFDVASEVDVLNLIKSHAHRELLQPFDSLKARIPTLVREVELASYLIHLFTEDLKQENTVRTHKTAFVAISKHRALPYSLRKAINLLVYLGILERQAPAKLGHSRETADRLLLNPALIISENLLADSGKRRLSLRENNEGLRRLEPDKFKEYGRNNKALLETVAEAVAIDTKPCPHCGTDLPMEARFCNNCGAPQSVRTILDEILALPSTELELPPGTKARLIERFPTVGDVFRATDKDIDDVEWIGPMRVAIIRHAVDELISG